MNRHVGAVALLALATMGVWPASAPVFPYPYTIDDLSNGLRLVTVHTDFPHIVALQVVMQVGSRNEVESGRTGYAHFFEHMSFRGTEHFSSDQIEQMEKRMGVDSNAYTSDDMTVFYETFDRANLAKQMMIDADRARHLKYSLADFQTESRAVLGEYNKDFADPLNDIDEVLRNTAFDQHTYKHTTMGFLPDVEAMPGGYDYSIEFYHRYYRPENAIVLVVGDVPRDQVLPLVQKDFGGWQPGAQTPPIPAEPEQTAPRTAHVSWKTPTLPWVVVAYKSPPYSDDTPDTAALHLLENWAWGENSAMYQRLVVNEQKVDAIYPMFSDRRDGFLVGVEARVKNVPDVPYVRDLLVQTCEHMPMPSTQQLDDLKSHMRYSFALQMDSTEAIADTLAPYLALRRTPDTINKLYQESDRLDPDGLETVASRWFVPAHRTIVTLDNQPWSPRGAAGGE